MAIAIAVAGVPTIAQAAAPTEEPSSPLGSYLAGRFARGAHDTAAAAKYYQNALASDPDNEVILEQSFLMEATEGNWPEARKLAKAVVARFPTHRMAQLLLGLDAFKAGNYAGAEEHFKAAATGPIGEVTSNLAIAWVHLAKGDAKSALDLLEGTKQAEWAQFFLRYHRGLIADAAGRTADAKAAYEKIFKGDQRTLRVALAYAQHASHAGDAKLAKTIIQDHLKRTTNAHPSAKYVLDQLNSGHAQPLLLTTPLQGMAEVFYGLGEALTAEGGLPVGAIYLQYALYLEPNFPFALAAVAGVHEATRQYEAANEAYDKVPKGTPMETVIEIRKALNLNSLDKVDEAKAALEKVAAKSPGDIRAFEALGNIMRTRKRYAEAVDYYSKVIATFKKPDAQQWTYYYHRGTCYERLKKWIQAEADLMRALKLSPEQPLVLNYLGYSWVDMGRNLKQGLALIERAVQLKPDDGYIVDSLGWAHYKLGNYKEAVKHLERAVELRPEDPVLNDHLGDGFWRVGRTMEARFQWEQAMTLSPEPEDAVKIKEKLARGMTIPAAQASPGATAKKKSPRDGVRADARKAREGANGSPFLPFQ